MTPTTPTAQEAEMTHETLKPCPFCGGDAWLNDYEAKHGDMTPRSRCPQCYSCGCNLGYLPTPGKAIAAWNRRAAPAADDLRVTLTYTNWRGETAERTIIPMRVWWGATDWHPEPQWLLTAVDAEKGLERDFALKDFGQRAAPAADQWGGHATASQETTA